MEISVTGSDFTQIEQAGLDFARNRFNLVRGTAVDTNDKFLAEYIRLRVIPSFIAEQKGMIQRHVRETLQKRVTVSSPSQLEQVQAAIESILPVPQLKTQVDEKTTDFTGETTDSEKV